MIPGILFMYYTHSWHREDIWEVVEFAQMFCVCSSWVNSLLQLLSTIYRDLQSLFNGSADLGGKAVLCKRVFSSQDRKFSSS